MGIPLIVYPALSIGIICSSSGSCDSFPLNKISVSNCDNAIDENGMNYTSILLTEQQQECYAVLDRIAEYKLNWNGNNAEPFPGKLIDRCRKIVQSLSIQPEIFPTAVGAIQFEFRKEDGSYLEFEVYTDTINEYRVFADGSDMEKENLSFADMKKEVDGF